jgi:hypothetical protein
MALTFIPGLNDFGLGWRSALELRHAFLLIASQFAEKICASRFAEKLAFVLAFGWRSGLPLR